MTKPVIEIENVSKQYRLGVVSTGALVADAKRWWARARGKPDPFAPVTAVNIRAEAATSDFVWALRDINLSIEQGEVLGIIGANGAGKSTLLKLLSRVTAPTEGEIRVKGRIASLLEVGTGFHPELTGRENVFLNGAILGMNKAEIRSKFDNIVEFSGCQRYIETPAKRYSSGMYVRLAFAVAAHLEPEILVVDEVLAVGDLEFQRKCLGKMHDVASRGRTVLFVSHNMAAIENLCTRAVQIDHGQIACEGSAPEVVSQYACHQLSRTGIGENIEEGRLYRRAETEEASDFSITTVEILNADGTAKNGLATWDSVKFRVRYCARRRVERGSVVLEVRDPRGTTMILCSTEPDSSVRMSINEGVGVVECHFPRWPLSAGEYLLSAALAVPGVEFLTSRDALCRLHVTEKSVFGSNLPPSSSRYLVAAEHQWEVIT